MAKRIISTPPQLTRLQRLTDAEDRLICNYRLLEESGRKIIAGTLTRVITSQVSEAQASNVTSLRFDEPDDDGAGEPTSLQRLTRRESDLMYAYRVLDPETKEMTDYLYAGYLSGEAQRGEEPRGVNVVSIRR